MIIGDRLRAIREEKNLSQGDVEKKTGLLRCYVSRVENGHTVPSVETLEKMARAFEVPLYQLFYDGDELPKVPAHLTRHKDELNDWGLSGKNGRYFEKLRRFLARMNEEDRKMLFILARQLAHHKAR